jgi:hypothetical protein
VLNVHGVHNVRHKDKHTAEPLVPESSLVEVETAIGNLKNYKSPGTDQLPAELIKAGGEMLCSVNEVIGDHQCGFRPKRPTTDQIFYIRQILEKNGSIMGRCISCL